MEPADHRNGLTRRTALKGTIASFAAGLGLPTLAERTRAQTTDDNWPQFHFDPVNTGHNPQAIGITREAEERWQFTDAWDRWHPTLIDDTIYVSTGMGGNTSEGMVFAINAADGTQQWAFDPDGRPNTTPAVVDGTAYIVDNNPANTVYAINAADGTEQWRFSALDAGSGVTVAGGVVYATTSFNPDNPTVFALDPADGSQRWAFNTRGRASVPAVTSDTLYVGSAAGNVHGFDSDTLHALDRTDGSVNWSHQILPGTRSAPVVSGSTVFVGSDDNNLYAFDTDTGTEKWRFDTGASIRAQQTPVVANGIVYVGNRDSDVFALDASTGEEQWQFSAGDGIFGLATDGEILYVSSLDSNVYGLDPATGNQEWQFGLGGPALMPIVVNDSVYVGRHDGNLYALSERAIEVTIDIKPCSDPNAIEPGAEGEIPVGIKHTDEFNPVDQVNVESLRFGAPGVVKDGGGASPARGGTVEDVVPCDGDGRNDLVVHFPTQDTGFDGDEDTGRLEGETTDGTPLFGTDSVKIVGR